jgi:hypothetical protein
MGSSNRILARHRDSSDSSFEKRGVEEPSMMSALPTLVPFENLIRWLHWHGAVENQMLWAAYTLFRFGVNNLEIWELVTITPEGAD